MNTASAFVILRSEPLVGEHSCFPHTASKGPIEEIRVAMREWPGRWEIVVVDDASTDRTADEANIALPTQHQVE